MIFQSNERKRGYLLAAPATLYVGLLLAVPIAITIAYSFWTQNYLEIDHTFTLVNYSQILSDELYRTLIFRSVKIACIVTFVTVFAAYPIAYFIAFYAGSRKALWLFIVTIPFWTSYLLRVFSWKLILGYNGVLNSALMWFGIIDEPLTSILYNANAVVITLAHAWAPFAILPIFVALEKIDPSVLEAANDLGENAFWRFVRVTLPLSMPGVVAASLIIFIPTVGDYVTPALVGGTDGAMVANLIQVQFGKAGNWPLGAALSVSAMVCVTIVALVYVKSLQLITRRIK